MTEDVAVSPATPLSQADDTSEWTADQSRAAAGVYQKIAELLPVEGRDYMVKISFNGGDSSPSLALTPMTDFGKTFVEHIYNSLRAQ